MGTVLITSESTNVTPRPSKKLLSQEKNSFLRKKGPPRINMRVFIPKEQFCRQGVLERGSSSSGIGIPIYVTNTSTSTYPT